MNILIALLSLSAPPQFPEPPQFQPAAVKAISHKPATRCGCDASCVCPGVQGGVCDCEHNIKRDKDGAIVIHSKAASPARACCSPQCECGCNETGKCDCRNVGVLGRGEQTTGAIHTPVATVATGVRLVAPPLFRESNYQPIAAPPAVRVAPVVKQVYRQPQPVRQTVAPAYHYMPAMRPAPVMMRGGACST